MPVRFRRRVSHTKRSERQRAAVVVTGLALPRGRQLNPATHYSWETQGQAVLPKRGHREESGGHSAVDPSQDLGRCPRQQPERGEVAEVVPVTSSISMRASAPD